MEKVTGKKIDCITVGAIETNCWLYRIDGADASGASAPCAIIDPGDEAGRIVRRLKELNWTPRYVFLTHGHLDHIAALPDLIEAFKESSGGENTLPKIAIHRLDAHYLGKDSLAFHRESFIAAGGNPVFVDALWKPMPDADVLPEEAETIGPFRVLHVPGHTQGSIALYDENAGALFTGDTLFEGDWGRTDLPGGNEEQICISLKRLLAMNGKITVYPGHGPAAVMEKCKNVLSLLQ